MTILPLGEYDPWALIRRADPAWIATCLILAVVAILAPSEMPGLVGRALASLLHTAPYILFAIGAVAYLKATNGEAVIAQVFKGSQVRMIVLAALVGGLAPFCSCEIIPFVAAMLALGVPLSAIMALWLASPLMDPAMFSITAAALGLEFAIGKTIAAISLGMFGGFVVMALSPTGYFADPIRDGSAPKSCCSAKQPFSETPVWDFWKEGERRAVFYSTAIENGLFLFKWLTLAYVLEAVMIRYVPADLIAGFLGGEGFQPILMGALLGGPAYLNGYAAVPLVAGLLEQGMAPGAAMSFVLAGGVSCIPAAIAVWALVKPKIFAAYIGLAFTGSLLAGIAWATWATQFT